MRSIQSCSQGPFSGSFGCNVPYFCFCLCNNADMHHTLIFYEVISLQVAIKKGRRRAPTLDIKVDAWSAVKKTLLNVVFVSRKKGMMILLKLIFVDLQHPIHAGRITVLKNIVFHHKTSVYFKIMWWLLYKNSNISYRAFTRTPRRFFGPISKIAGQSVQLIVQNGSGIPENLMRRFLGFLLPRVE